MSKERKLTEEHDDGSYVVKKSRKSSILAFILCLLIAFVIWAYADATENADSVATESAPTTQAE